MCRVFSGTWTQTICSVTVSCAGCYRGSDLGRCVWGMNPYVCIRLVFMDWSCAVFRSSSSPAVRLDWCSPVLVEKTSPQGSNKGENSERMNDDAVFAFHLPIHSNSFTEIRICTNTIHNKACLLSRSLHWKIDKNVTFKSFSLLSAENAACISSEVKINVNKTALFINNA